MKARANIITSLVIITTIALTGVGFADTPTPTPSVNDDARIQPYVQPGIVFVTVEWQAWLKDKRYPQDYMNNGNPITLRGSCTGYVVNPAGWIATAGHCVSYKEIAKDYLDAAVAQAIKENFYVTDNPSIIRSTLFDHLKTESSDSTGATAKPDREVTVSWGASVSGLEVEDGKPARVVAYQELEQGDGALLKVDEAEMNALILVPGDETVDTLTSIAAVGFPGSVDDVTDDNYNPSIKTGSVSSQKTIGGGLLPVYEIDAAVSPGMSGGPTVNYEGEVIGTNSFFPSGENQQFNFVGSSQRVLELMASNGVMNEQSEDTLTYREGIDAYFDGDKETAIAALEAVVEAQPANEMATDYLSRAQDLPATAPASEKDGVPLAAIIALVLLVILVLAVIGWIVGRKARQQNNSSQEPVFVPVPKEDSFVAPVQPPTTTETSKYCPSCGNGVSWVQKFCNNCGTNLSS